MYTAALQWMQSNISTEWILPLSNNKKTWHPYTEHYTTYIITLPRTLKRNTEHNLTYIRKTAMKYVHNELKDNADFQKTPLLHDTGSTLWVRFKIRSLNFSNWPNPSNRIMVLRSTQPMTEKSTRNLPGVKGQPARKADNLTTICEPIV
jgi:hypothetical protein